MPAHFPAPAAARRSSWLEKGCSSPLPAALYAGFVYALLPRAVVAMNDDFAYLRSVVLTLQHGRPWTDDWLEPWNAGFAGVSALLFKLTHSFHFATYALLALCAGVFFHGLCTLLRSRGLSAPRAALVTLLVATLPTVFWKTIEFTGVSFYLACLVSALLAAEKRRWTLFAVAWILALSSRQSAAVWGVLPLAAMVEDRAHSRGSRRAWLGPVIAIMGGAASYLLLDATMNKTVAQRLVTDHAWTNLQVTEAHAHCTVAALGLIAGIGTAALARGELCFAGISRWRERLGWWLAGGVGLVVFFASAPLAEIEFEHESYRLGWNGVVGAGGFVTALLATLFADGRIRWLALTGAFVSLLIVGLRGQLWDYYLVDVALFGLLAFQPRGEPTAHAPRVGLAIAQSVFAAGALIVATVSIAQFKSRLDRANALCQLSSRAIEEGSLAPRDASALPFGLMAWYFFPLHVEKSPLTAGNLADFGRFLNHDTTLSAWRFSKPLRSWRDHDGDLPPRGADFIAYGKFNYAWFWGVEVMLLKGPAAAVQPAAAPYPADYGLPRFPRDDRGWRELIDAK